MAAMSSPAAPTTKAGVVCSFYKTLTEVSKEAGENDEWSGTAIARPAAADKTTTRNNIATKNMVNNFYNYICQLIRLKYTTNSSLPNGCEMTTSSSMVINNIVYNFCSWIY